MEKDIPANSESKKAGVDCVISVRQRKLRSKAYDQSKGVYSIMIEGSTNQEDLAILNVYVHHKSSKIRDTKMDATARTSPITMKDGSSVIYKASTQTFCKDKEDLNNTINHFTVISFHRTFDQQQQMHTISKFTQNIYQDRPYSVS